ncbi:MAG: sulfurtransferase TusA family protein [Hyphomicrobiaceae bacterium]
MVDKTLDVRGLQCPLPILKTKRALASVGVGGLLEVLTTDPGSPDDFVAFCESTGNQLVAQSRSGQDEFRFIIRRID